MQPQLTLPPIGLQPIVLGKQYSLQDDSVLAFIAAQGVRWLECGSNEPESYRQQLARHGLQQAGAHTGCWDLQEPRSLIEKIKILGGKHLCNSGLREWHKRTRADYDQTIAILNQAGRLCREEGIALHYHNHDFEFTEQVDGVSGFQVLMDGLNPDYVDLCVDIGWVVRSGVDLLPFLRTYKDRIGYIHCKDWNGQHWVELGQGQVDLRGFFALLPELTKVQFVMLEQDDTQIDPLESIRISRSWVRTEIGL